MAVTSSSHSLRARAVRLVLLVDVDKMDNDIISDFMKDAMKCYGGGWWPIVIHGAELTTPQKAFMELYDPDVVLHYPSETKADKLLNGICMPMAVSYYTGHGSLRYEFMNVLSMLPDAFARRYSRPSHRVNLVDLGTEFAEDEFMLDNFGYFGFTTYSDLFSCYTKSQVISTQLKTNGKGKLGQSPIYEEPDLSAFSKLVFGPQSAVTSRSLCRFGCDRFCLNIDSNDKVIVIGDSFQDRVLHWNMHFVTGFHISNTINVVRLLDCSSDISKMILSDFCLSLDPNGKFIIASASLDTGQIDQAVRDLEVYTKYRRVVSNVYQLDTFYRANRWRGWSAEASGKTRVIKEASFVGADALLPLVQIPALELYARHPTLSSGLWIVEDRCKFKDDLMQSGHINFSMDRNLIDIQNSILHQRESISGGYTAVRIMREGEVALFQDYSSNTKLALKSYSNILISSVGAYASSSPVHGLMKFSNAEGYFKAAPSDKARLFDGVVSLFGSYNTANSFLCHGFTQLLLDKLGVKFGTVENYDLTPFVNKMNKIGLPARLSGTVSNEDLAQIGKRALLVLHSLREPEKYVRTEVFYAMWEAYLKNTAIPLLSGEDSDEVFAEAKGFIEPYLSSLALCRILERGYFFSCPKCHHHNWRQLNQLDSLLSCENCTARHILPPSFQVSLKVNDFIRSSLDRQNIYSVFAAINQVRGVRDSRFMFSPSVEFYGDSKGYESYKPEAEIDLIVQIDGRSYVVEIKNGGGISEAEIVKTISIAKKLSAAGAMFIVKDHNKDLINLASRCASSALYGGAVQVIDFSPSAFMHSYTLPLLENYF